MVLLKHIASKDALQESFIILYAPLQNYHIY